MVLTLGAGHSRESFIQLRGAHCDSVCYKKEDNAASLCPGSHYIILQYKPALFFRDAFYSRSSRHMPNTDGLCLKMLCKRSEN